MLLLLALFTFSVVAYGADSTQPSKNVIESKTSTSLNSEEPPANSRNLLVEQAEATRKIVNSSFRNATPLRLSRRWQRF